MLYEKKKKKKKRENQHIYFVGVLFMQIHPSPMLILLWLFVAN